MIGLQSVCDWFAVCVYLTGDPRVSSPPAGPGGATGCDGDDPAPSTTLHTCFWSAMETVFAAPPDAGARPDSYGHQSTDLTTAPATVARDTEDADI